MEHRYYIYTHTHIYRCRFNADVFVESGTYKNYIYSSHKIPYCLGNKLLMIRKCIKAELFSLLPLQHYAYPYIPPPCFFL